MHTSIYLCKYPGLFEMGGINNHYYCCYYINSIGVHNTSAVFQMKFESGLRQTSCGRYVSNSQKVGRKCHTYKAHIILHVHRQYVQKHFKRR